MELLGVKDGSNRYRPFAIDDTNTERKFKTLAAHFERFYVGGPQTWVVEWGRNGCDRDYTHFAPIKDRKILLPRGYLGAIEMLLIDFGT